MNRALEPRLGPDAHHHRPHALHRRRARRRFLRGGLQKSTKVDNLGVQSHQRRLEPAQPLRRAGRTPRRIRTRTLVLRRARAPILILGRARLRRGDVGGGRVRDERTRREFGIVVEVDAETNLGLRRFASHPASPSQRVGVTGTLASRSRGFERKGSGDGSVEFVEFVEFVGRVGETSGARETRPEETKISDSGFGANVRVHAPRVLGGGRDGFRGGDADADADADARPRPRPRPPSGATRSYRMVGSGSGHGAWPRRLPGECPVVF